MDPVDPFRSDGTPREKRWLVLSQDGRHTWLGRHRDPDSSDIEQAAEGLARQGITGWLAVSEGVYYDASQVITVMIVKPLHGEGDFESAVEAFQAERRRRLAEPR
jgi:hypothetical protein